MQSRMLIVSMSLVERCTFTPLIHEGRRRLSKLILAVVPETDSVYICTQHGIWLTVA